jgi:hypothetical protein
MTTAEQNSSDVRVTYLALTSIQEAMTALRRPTGTVEEFGGAVHGPRDTYRYQTTEELAEVTDDLIGAAFAVAQSYISKNKKSWTPTMTNINHVANYWKHRDQWGPTWANAWKDTLAGVQALGATAPVYAGQVKNLAGACLGADFDADRLWQAINP